MVVMSARSTGGKEGRGDSCNRQHLAKGVLELRSCIEVQVAAPQGLVVLRIAVVLIEVSILIRHDGCCAAGEDAGYDPAGLVKGPAKPMRAALQVFAAFRCYRARSRPIGTLFELKMPSLSKRPVGTSAYQARKPTEQLHSVLRWSLWDRVLKSLFQTENMHAVGVLGWRSGDSRTQ